MTVYKYVQKSVYPQGNYRCIPLETTALEFLGTKLIYIYTFSTLYRIVKTSSKT